MRIIQSLKVLLIPVLFLSCNDAGQKKSGSQIIRQLPGEWRDFSIKITMNSFGNKDTTRVFEVNEANWEQRMKMRPVKTVFFGDGTYFTEHRDLNDSVVYLPFGTWKVTGDTISMQDTMPQRGQMYRYRITIKDGIAEYSGLQDCDGDGKADDNFLGLQRKIK